MYFNQLLQQGAAHAWLYFPVALVLGALHGLEPGHSKTMMAAFIVAVRGTVAQAALLGLSAAISHSLVIWAIAGLALAYGSQWNTATVEPWFQIATGVIVIGMAAWTLSRLRKGKSACSHDHDHLHDHDKPMPCSASDDSARHAHDHDHGHEEKDDDEHSRQHAGQIQARFAGRAVTTPQIILFGLTGGLMPCPAALTILLVCLQLKKFTLGFSLVAAFSIGLALTLVTVGVAAAWGIRKASERSGLLSRLAARAPWLSSTLLIVLGTAFLARGLWRVL